MASIFRDNTAPSRFADYRASKPDSRKLQKKIETDVEKYLSNGGEIKKIETGASGVEPDKRKFIINYEPHRKTKK